MSAVMATEFLIDTREYEATEVRLRKWGMECRRRDQQRAAYIAMMEQQYARRPDSNTGRASEAVNVFHRKERQETRKERLKRLAHEQAERLRRDTQRKAIRRMRRGSGPVRKCPECRTIYRGEAETCGCRPCAHCNTRFRGAGFKCERCSNDPDLLTARGKQSRGGSARETPIPVGTLSPESARVDALISALYEWMGNALKRRFLWEQNDLQAADELMIPVAVFAGRARAAVERVALLLAIEESPRL